LSANQFPVIRPPANRLLDVTPRLSGGGPATRAAGGGCPGKGCSGGVGALPRVTGKDVRRLATVGPGSNATLRDGGCPCKAGGKGCPCSNGSPLDTAVPTGGRIGPGPANQPRWYYPPVTRQVPQPKPLLLDSVGGAPDGSSGPAIPPPGCRYESPYYTTCGGSCPPGYACCDRFPGGPRGYGECRPATGLAQSACLGAFRDACLFANPDHPDDCARILTTFNPWHDEDPVLVCDP